MHVEQCDNSTFLSLNILSIILYHWGSSPTTHSSPEGCWSKNMGWHQPRSYRMQQQSTQANMWPNIVGRTVSYSLIMEMLLGNVAGNQASLLSTTLNLLQVNYSFFYNNTNMFVSINLLISLFYKKHSQTVHQTTQSCIRSTVAILRWTWYTCTSRPDPFLPWVPVCWPDAVHAAFESVHHTFGQTTPGSSPHRRPSSGHQGMGKFLLIDSFIPKQSSQLNHNPVSYNHMANTKNKVELSSILNCLTNISLLSFAILYSYWSFVLIWVHFSMYCLHEYLGQYAFSSNKQTRIKVSVHTSLFGTLK